MSADVQVKPFSARQRNASKIKAQAAWTHLEECVKGQDGDEVPVRRHARDKSSKDNRPKDKQKKVLLHGMQYSNSFSVADPILDILYNEIAEEYVVLDESNTLSFYRQDGHHIFNVLLDDQLAKLAFMSHQMRYVGLVKQQVYSEEESDEASTLVLYSKNFEVLSKYHENIPIQTIVYNPFRRMLLSCGLGNVTAWALHYEDTHLIPEVSSKSSEVALVDFSMVLFEHNAGYNQQVFSISQNNCFVFKAQTLDLKQTKRSLHVRNISCALYFNPAKCLLTGSIDGSIKMWDENWCVKVVFVGHNNPVSSLSVYPNGPFVISSSSDNSIRVWSLETSDESAIIDVHSEAKMLISHSGFRSVAAVFDAEVYLYTAEDLFSLFTSIGEPVKKIRKTSRYFDYRRLTCSCEDGSVRIVCPNTGNVLGTVLLGYEDRVKDSYFVSRLNYTFCLLEGNEIVKANMTSNPAVLTDRWNFKDHFRGHKITCFCIYEHIGGKEILKEEATQSSKDLWKGVVRAVETAELERAVSELIPENMQNPVLLFVGLDDGDVCLVDIEAGSVTFEMTAHEMSKITCIVANPEFDQLITAGTDKVVKVWKVSPFAEVDTVVSQFPIFFPGTPTHVCCLKNKIMVAYQDSSVGLYACSIQTQEKSRFDHPRTDDHTDKVISVAASVKMKLFATAGEDETVRIWTDHGRLIRVLRLNAPLFSVEFANDSGDIVIGIGDHLYRIAHTSYFTKNLLYKALTIALDDLKIETPTPYDESRLQSLDMVDLKRLKAAHCSEMNFTYYEDTLPQDEQTVIDKEFENEKSKYFELAKRDAELEMLRNGQYDALKKSKKVYNERVKQMAFKRYLSIFFQNVKVELPKIEESFHRGNTKIDQKTKYQPPLFTGSANIDDSGFFPSINKHANKQLPALSLSGYLPNSVALKSLYPEDVLKEHEEQFKPREFTAEEIAEMEYYNRVRVKDVEPEDTLLEEDDLPPTPPEAAQTKSGLLEKMQKAARTPSPSPEPEKTEAELEAERRDARVREIQQGEANKAAKEQELIADKRSKPVRKYVSRPKQKSPEPKLQTPPLNKKASLFEEEENAATARPPTPLPDFIVKARGQDWYDKFFPNLNERTFPKPWSASSFAQMVLRYVKTCELQYKAPMVDYLKDLHLEWNLYEMRDAILEALIFVLNKSDAPSGETIYGRTFFHACLRIFLALNKFDVAVVKEAMCIYLEKDVTTKKVALETFKKMGVEDPQRFFYKNMDSWSLPIGNDPNYKRELMRMCGNWLEEWIRKLSEQVEYVIDELKCGNMLLPGPIGKKFQSKVKFTSSDLPEPTRSVVTVLDRLPGDMVDYISPVEAINYYTECELRDFLDRTDQVRKDMMDSSNRKTVLVLPKVPVQRSVARVGELHTSKCRKKRESSHVDVTLRARQSKRDVWDRFTTHINLPMNNVYMNPFGDELDHFMAQLREQQPILLMLKSNQKFFVPENSLPPPL